MDDFLDFKKPMPRCAVPFSARDLEEMEMRQRQANTEKEPEVFDDGRYSKEFQEKARQELIEKLAYSSTAMRDSSALTSNTEIPPIALIADDNNESMDAFMKEPNSITCLPISAQKDAILRAIQLYRVTIISGNTGCGKTTQVPQYVLDDCYKKNVPFNIIVTQPRRIAATSICERVCDERGWPTGTICSYQIGLDQTVSNDTRLLYCTTGILLRKLSVSRTLQNYSHIFLDEVHERSQEMDFTLLLIRILMNTSQTKIILMSATMDHMIYVNYFNQWEHSRIFVEAPSRFTVQTYYLDKFDTPGRSLNKFMSDSRACIHESAVLTCLEILRKIEATSGKNSAVLIFLPGLLEIEELTAKLMEMEEHKNWIIIQMHSSVPREEQARAMSKYKDSIRKIILATNIAESSITVPDVEFVIDFCLTKNIKLDRGTGLSSLRLNWISKYEATQRAGRVGRVSHGRVYRLVPLEFYKKFDRAGTPEMVRAPLESTVLRAKTLNLGDPVSILSQAIAPPNKHDVEKSILQLKEAGALALTVNGVFKSNDGDMTFLGKFISQLPLSYQLGKLVALGYACGVPEDAAIIAAFLNLQYLFTCPMNRNEEAYVSLRTWANGYNCDAIAALRAYRAYRHSLTNGEFHRADDGSGASWARQCFLQLRTLKEMDILVREIHERLKENTLEMNTASNESWDLETRYSVIKFVIAGAFYQNYYQVRCDSTEEMALRELNNFCPFNTVILRGFPIGRVGPVYTKVIQEFFSTNDKKYKCFVTFDNNKILLEFPSNKNKNPHNKTRLEPFCIDMYTALYKKLMRKTLTLNLLPYETEKELAEKFGLIEYAKRNQFTETFEPQKGPHRREKSNLPSVTTNKIDLKIVRSYNPGHFFAEYANKDESVYEELKRIMNNSDLKHKVLVGSAGIGCLYLLSRDGDYLRASVEEIYERSNEAQVLYIDIGRRGFVKLKQLLIPDPKIAAKVYNVPAAILECRLAKIVSTVDFDERRWSRKSQKDFDEAINESELYGDVYSVVEGVVRLTLFAQKPSETININEMLLEKKHAEIEIEAYQSERNHKIRTNDIIEDAIEQFNNEQRVRLRMPEPKYPDLDGMLSIKKECLTGPMNPITCSLAPICNQAVNFVRLGTKSTNAIIFEPSPHDPHDRLLIGHSAWCGRDDNNSITIQTSTLMPNAPGLASLLPVLFSPRVQLRTDSLGTRYVSALCGLGINSDGNPIYPDKDFNVVFDVELDNSDIRQMNKMRNAMSNMLYTSEVSEAYPNYSRPDYFDAVKKIKSCFAGLLLARKKRNMIYPDQRTRFIWKNDGYKPDMRLLYPPIQITTLCSTKAFFDKLQDIYRVISGSEPAQEMPCPICGGIYSTDETVSGHYWSLAHKRREAELFE